MWVANSDYESGGRGWVSEFSAATGALIRVISPVAGAHIWATDTNFYSYRGWVAELSARTGGLVRVIGARSGHLERS